MSRLARHFAGVLGICAKTAILLPIACTSQMPALQHRQGLATVLGDFVLEFSEADSSVVDRLSRGVEGAAPSIRRWGELRSPVKLEVLPTHELLEEAVNRQGYDWLKAWARYDEVFLQSPRTWGLIGPKQSEVTELLTHELTHCMMYQQSSERLSWSDKGFPLWFREGMASYTAGQGYRWPRLEDLARFLDGHPREDPIQRPEELYRTESDIVYSAAHHAFSYLVQRQGESGVRAILHAMLPGPKFSEAFEQVTGTRVEQFTAEFKQYVAGRRFRAQQQAQARWRLAASGQRSALRSAAAGLSRSGGRSFPSIARCNSISCNSVEGATVETATFPLSAPQKPLKMPAVRLVAMILLIELSGVPTISTPRTSVSLPSRTSTR